MTVTPDRWRASEAQHEYRLATGPIKTTLALAQQERGADPSAGQTAFERHLPNLRSMRAETERLNPGDPAAAARHMDTLLVSYSTALIQ